MRLGWESNEPGDAGAKPISLKSSQRWPLDLDRFLSPAPLGFGIELRTRERTPKPGAKGVYEDRSSRLSPIQVNECSGLFSTVEADGPGLIPRMVKSRVPPVPRLWGPGKGNRAVCSASTQAVASPSRTPSIPIRFLRFGACPFDKLRPQRIKTDSAQPECSAERSSGSIQSRSQA